ncbi:MAG: TonB-dependent receptor [Bacteroidota bacterium]
MTTATQAQETPPDSGGGLLVPQYGWTYRSFTLAEIREQPARDLGELLSLTPGIAAIFVESHGRSMYTPGRGPISEESGLYVRGSRNGEIEYRVNGLSMLDRFTNSFSLPFIPEAVEEVVVHTGAYGASLGSSGGGVVEMKLRRGGERWEVSAQHLTDDFAATGSPFLNTYSYGQHTSVLTAGGPLAFGSRLFIAAEIHRMRDRTPRWVEPFSYELQPSPYSYPLITSLPRPLEFRTNHVPASSLDRSSFVWNLTTSALGPDIRFWGILASTRTRDANYYSVLRNYFRQERIPSWDDIRSVVALSAAQEIIPGLHLRATVVRDIALAHTTDPDFGEDWRIYSDSAANARKGYTGFQERYHGPAGYVTNVDLYFEHQNSPNNAYTKRSLGSWRTAVQADADITSAWTVSMRAEAEWWTLRTFTVSSISGLRTLLDTDRDGVDDREFIDDQTRDRSLRSYISGYGYDTNGDPTDASPYGARRPFFGAVSAASRWQDGPLRLELGARSVWVGTDVPTPRRADTLTGLWTEFPYDPQNYLVDASAIEPAGMTAHVLPRASALFTEGPTEIFFSWGRFLTILPMNDLHLDYRRFSYLLGPYRVVPWDPRSSVLTSSARPEITNMGETGIRWQVTNAVRLETSIFTKSMPGQIQLGTVWVDSLEIQPTGFVNSGESRAIGFEGTLEWTPAPEVRMQLGYGFLEARGRSSSPRGNFTEVTDPPIATPEVRYPLDYEQSHRFIVDLRYTASGGTLFDGLSAWMTGRLLSGHPYTKVAQPISAGSLFPWFVPMVSFVYPQYGIPEEPRNASFTPWTFTLDLTASYRVNIGPAFVRAVIAVTNVLNTREVINVFPTTGSATDDGWLTSELAQNALQYYAATPFAGLYRALNLKNRWAYISMTGNDIYAPPRQIRVGVEVGI